MVPKRPSCSPLMPAVKNKVFAGPAFASLPKVRDQSPSMVRTESSGFFTKPMNLYVKPLNAAILPLPKLPTRMVFLFQDANRCRRRTLKRTIRGRAARRSAHTGNG